MPNTDIAIADDRSIASPSADEQRRLLKQLLASERLTDAEFDLFAEVCRRTNMDPFRRQIYAIKRRTRENVDGEWRWVDKMTIVFAIGGLQAQARRDGLAGRDKTVYTYAPNDEKRKWPFSAEVTVYRRDPRTGERDAYTAEVFFSEFCPMKNEKVDGVERRVPSGKWATMPHAMLSKCAEAAALRMGFPESLSGMHVGEEFDHSTHAERRTRSTVRASPRTVDDLVRRTNAPATAEEDDVYDYTDNDEMHDEGEA